MKKVLLGLLVVALAFGAWYGFSRYLVSKLDGRGAPTATAGVPYSSEDGISFMYPDSYRLSSKTMGNAEYSWDTLQLIQKDAAAVPGGEAPPAISLSVFGNLGGLSLEQWVRGDARSDFKLLDGTLLPATVGGDPALAYRRTGLYEADVVAVLHKGKIFLFEGEWLAAGDPARTDFQNIVDSVHFTL